MNLEQINQELVAAMKAKDEVKTSTLRLVIAAAANKRIEVGHELNDEEFLDVIGKEAKKRKESIDAFGKAGRDDLVAKETQELEILSAYLPEQMSEEELAKIVDETIAQTEASGSADFGKVIGNVMGKVKGKADGNTVSKIVREKLA